MVGRHCSKLTRLRPEESWRCSRHERRSERVRSGSTGRRTTSSRYPMQDSNRSNCSSLSSTLAGQELTDARLMHPTEPRQLRLGDARHEHHLTQHIASTSHSTNIALHAMGIEWPGTSTQPSLAREPSRTAATCSMDPGRCLAGCCPDVRSVALTAAAHAGRVALIWPARVGRRTA
jgi:hypothetical protein